MAQSTQIHGLCDPLVPELPEDCRGRWESFVEETLTETNRRNTVDLVSWSRRWLLGFPRQKKGIFLVFLIVLVLLKNASKVE